MKKEVLLDLFAGFGGAELSAKMAGIKLEKSYISEVNPNALKVLKKHYPKAIFVGDVRFLNAKDFLDTTIICAGSPCQCFSFAGLGKGMITTTDEEIYTLKKYLKLKREGFEFEGESYLFWEFVRLYTEITQLQRLMGLPEAKFILENVDMDIKWENVITNALGVKPIKFNASLVSAQHRPRIYWTNIENIVLPKDMGIKLGDVIKGAVTGAGFRGRKIGEDKNGKKIWAYPKTETENNKANCLVTTLGTITKEGKYYGTGFYVNNRGKVNKLTIEQAEILQGLASGYTKVDGVSDTARIKMIGNGWCVLATMLFFVQYKKNKSILKSKKNLVY
jgi:DNA (cytosine-5)-methyltransferase 3A